MITRLQARQYLQKRMKFENRSMNVFSTWRRGCAGALVAGLAAFTGCGKSSDADLKMARTPKEAASQIEQAFSSADADAQKAAAAAAQAMRNDDYEKAVVSLQTVRIGPSVTVDQGLAIHSSTVALEARLINAIASGDKNAERAYELLKAMKRK